MPYKDPERRNNTSVRCSWCRQWTMKPWNQLRKSKTGKAFCGKVCQDKWLSASRMGNLHHNVKPEAVSVSRPHCLLSFDECRICGKSYTLRSGKEYCCSDECFKAWTARRQLIYHRKHINCTLDQACFPPMLIGII